MSVDGLGKKDVLAVLAITAAGRLVYYLSGVRFDASTLDGYMQFIDTELLVTRLLESLWYYHANPPILNLFTGTVLKLGDWFPENAGSAHTPSRINAPNGDTLEEVQRAHIIEVLEACDWKVRGTGGAAERLGLKRTTLQSRMKKLGIERPGV